MRSLTLTSYEWSVDTFRLLPIVFSCLHEFGSAAEEAPPSKENILNQKPDFDFLLVVG
jgi:hypothetical protein